MDYPGNFDTSAFPAGKRIAVSRIMVIWTLIAFFMIIFLCGFLLWVARSERLSPFLISVNKTTGEWQVVGRSADTLEYTVGYTMQESLVGNFAQDWFKISINNDENQTAWGKCDRAACTTGRTLLSGARSCAVYCASGDDVHSKFFFDIVPGYEQRVGAGEVWEIDSASISIAPAGKILDQGGTWLMRATVVSNVEEAFEIEAFVKVARNNNYYPLTMGFYIADFNAYRID